MVGCVLRSACLTYDSMIGLSENLVRFGLVWERKGGGGGGARGMG